MSYNHTTVLLEEAVQALCVRPGMTIIDGTLGGGGHSEKIAELLSGSGMLHGFDVDIEAIEASKRRLCRYDNVSFHHANYADMADYVSSADGLVLDLGYSSHHVDTERRGFSFHFENADIDMRMSGSGLSAYDIVNGYDESELARILFRYGDEKHSRSIARGIVKARQAAPIKTTGELAEIIRSNVPISYRNASHPARKSFQAIRIETNSEFTNISRGIRSGFELLNNGGRLAVISFHSTEDALVKGIFAEFTAGCSCDKRLPVCVCGIAPRAVSVVRKPIVPSAGEIERNNRARTAKLRVLEKC